MVKEKIGVDVEAAMSKEDFANNVGSNAALMYYEATSALSDAEAFGSSSNSVIEVLRNLLNFVSYMKNLDKNHRLQAAFVSHGDQYIISWSQKNIETFRPLQVAYDNLAAAGHIDQEGLSHAVSWMIPRLKLLIDRVH